MPPRFSSHRRPAERRLRRQVAALQQQLDAAQTGYAARLRLFREILDSATNGRAILDAQLRYVLVNPKLAEINGAPEAAHIGRTPAEVVPLIAPTLEPILRRVLERGEPVVDVRVTGVTGSAPGRLRHFVASYFPLRSFPGVNVVVNEVTEQQEAEDALRASEERFRAIVETSQNVILLTDAASTITYASPAAKPVLGYTPAHLVGRRLAELVNPADLAAVVAQHGDLRSSIGTSVVFTARVRHSDGRWRWFQVTRNNQLGNPAINAVVGSLRDVTEQKQAEEAAAAARRAEQATLAELEASRGRLREIGERLVAVQEEERRHLALELHDEIGQELTALSLLLALAPALPPEQLAERLATARRQVGEIIAVVRQRSLDLRPVMLDDLGLTAALRALTGRFAAQTGIAVDFAAGELSAPLPRQIALTAYRIVQEALTNIARHAAAASAEVRLWQADDNLLVQVKDAGRGFDVAAIRARQASSGLVGMHERVALLGGELSVDSEPGQGTQLLAVLPLGPRGAPGGAG